MARADDELNDMWRKVNEQAAQQVRGSYPESVPSILDELMPHLASPDEEVPDDLEPESMDAKVRELLRDDALLDIAKALKGIHGELRVLRFLYARQTGAIKPPTPNSAGFAEYRQAVDDPD